MVFRNTQVEYHSKICLRGSRGDVFVINLPSELPPSKSALEIPHGGPNLNHSTPWSPKGGTVHMACTEIKPKPPRINNSALLPLILITVKRNYLLTLLQLHYWDSSGSSICSSICYFIIQWTQTLSSNRLAFFQTFSIFFSTMKRGR